MKIVKEQFGWKVTYDTESEEKFLTFLFDALFLKYCISHDIEWGA